MGVATTLEVVRSCGVQCRSPWGGTWTPSPTSTLFQLIWAPMTLLPRKRPTVPPSTELMSVSYNQLRNQISWILSIFQIHIDCWIFSLLETRQGSKNKNKNNNNNNNNNGGSETENLALEAVKRFGVTEQFCSCSSGCVEDATVALPNARLVSGCKMAYFDLFFNIFFDNWGVIQPGQNLSCQIGF